MKRLLYILLFISSFSMFGFRPDSRWYCPEDIYDEYWNVIDSMVPDTIRFHGSVIPISKYLAGIKDLNALDSLMNEFYKNYHNATIPVDKNSHKISISQHLFPAYVLKSISTMLGYEIGIISHGGYYVDRVEKLFEWYRHNKDKIDINILKRLTAADFVRDFVTEFYYTCSELYEIRTQNQAIDCFDPMENWVGSMSNEEKLIMDSIFELYPDSKALKLKLLNDKLEYFRDIHDFLLINDSTAIKLGYNREDI